MRKVLAVSGGIDSVVMLHLFHDDSDAIVAHFNHNIRDNSAEDCDFVARLAQRYHRHFISENANLRANASEAEARQARYDFLNRVCTEHNGKLYVAHHKDDIYETIAINIIRGTGWRGLAPLRNPNIVRPLLNWSKKDIYLYATKNKLAFRQDQTNTEDTYLRNRVRERLRFLTNEQKAKLDHLYQRQCELSININRIISDLTSKNEKHISRELFQGLDDRVATELLRELLYKNSISQTRPQMRRAIDAIRTYRAGKQFPLGKNAYIEVAKYHFSIKKRDIQPVKTCLFM